jgi:predicted transcriptional regulator
MTERRRKGEVQQMIRDFIDAHPVSTRLTPYSIAKSLEITAGSAHAACKSLVRDGHVTLYGDKPYMVGPRQQIVRLEA